MRGLAVRDLISGYWVGAGALSNMGFYIPTSSAHTPMTELKFQRCSEFDHVCEGEAYLVKSCESGLMGEDYWMYAHDIEIPSIIYRSLSSNNKSAYVFDLVPISAEQQSFHLKSVSSQTWISVTGPRLTVNASKTTAAKLKFYYI